MCQDPLRNAFVNEYFARGASALMISRLSREKASRDIGIAPIAYHTVLRHVEHRENPVAPPIVPPPTVTAAIPRIPIPEEGVVTVVAPLSPSGKTRTVTDDVATLVAKRAAEGIKNGELKVNTNHGLSAQKMLDAREDKRRDRELAVNLARMLSGNMAVPEHLVMRDVTPLETGEDVQDFVPALGEGARTG